jgi:ankyrin repeat protein
MSEALFPAAANEHAEIFHYLLNQGADINFTINEKTPFDHAVEFKRLMFASKVKKLGGKSYTEMERDA